MPLGGPTEVTSTASSFAREITSIICGGDAGREGNVFYTPEAVQHITLFATANDLPAGEEPPPELLEAEVKALKGLSASWDPFELEVHSVVVMPSGTVLLLWVPVPESGSDPESTRREYEAIAERDFSAPGGGVPNIFHSSLGRICFGCSLEVEQLDAVEAACARATQALRGSRCVFDRLWYVTDSDEVAMEATAPSKPAERGSLRRKWLTATNVIRNGEIVSLELD